jgi:hypothetical protein
VLALQLADLMRLTAHRAGHDLSVRAILDTLAGIAETVLIYPSTGGRPKARRMTTDMTTDQQPPTSCSTYTGGHPHRLRSYTAAPENPCRVRRKPLKIDLSGKVPL